MASNQDMEKLKEENYWMYQYEVAIKEDHERLRKAIEDMEVEDHDDDDYDDEA